LTVYTSSHVRKSISSRGGTVGELACGSIRNRVRILTLLRNLPAASVASHDEAMLLIESRSLHGKGLGWIDVHLVASAMVSHDSLWTKDRKLAAAAKALQIADSP